MALNDTRIRNLKPKDRPYKLVDGAGLHLEVRPASERSPKGVLLWRYRFRIAGKESMLSLGSYPEVSLLQAREGRDAARKLVKQGINPSHQRKTERLRSTYESANTFEAVALEWLEKSREHWTHRSYVQRRNILQRDIFPDIGSLPLRQITPAHVHAVLAKVHERAPKVVVIARQCISGTCQLAIATMRADMDLAYPLRRAFKLPTTVHKSPLRVSQIPSFFKALDSFGGSMTIKVAVRLMWWTLARPTEVLGARWEEFDLEAATWTIPAHRMKMRQPHAVPLPKQAVELLKLLHAVKGSSPCVVPNRHDPSRPGSSMTLSKAFYSMGYRGKFSPHCVRVTGRTILGEQGHPHDVLERQLAHREAKEVRAYNQGDRLEARRVIMQGWADYLEATCAGSNVVNLNGRRA